MGAAGALASGDRTQDQQDSALFWNNANGTSWLKIGVDVAEGDVIAAVNGVPTLSVADIGSLLRDQADHQVLLRVKPKAGGEREVVVTPVSQQREQALRYAEWEYTRRLAVENDEEGLSPLALANDGRARGEAAGAREIRDPLHVPLRERREKRNPVKDIDPFRAERLVARPGSGTEDELVDSDLPHRATISSRAG